MAATILTLFLALLAVASGSGGRGSKSALQSTDDPGIVVINQVRIILDRKGSQMEVQQMIRLHSMAGKVFVKDSGYLITLAKGATAASLMGEEQKGIELLKDLVFVKIPITPKDIIVSVRYKLPIKGGMVVLDQALSPPLENVQVLSIFTQGEVVLKGKGFTSQGMREISGGLKALDIFARTLESGRIFVSLSGLTYDVQKTRSFITLISSIVILAVGLILWLKQRTLDRS